jgi:hypothetical protein
MFPSLPSAVKLFLGQTPVSLGGNTGDSVEGDNK